MKVSKFSRLLLSLLMAVMIMPAAYAQQQKVTVQLKNASLVQLFKAIENQTGYKFSYRESVIDKKNDITVSFKDATVQTVLETAFAGKDLAYEVVSENSILVVEKKAAPQAGKKKTIAGCVVDQTGLPVIGCAVVEKNENNGTVTDIDGKFSITVKDGATLQLSSLGYVTQDVHTAGKTNLSIILSEDTEMLNEVVIVGYGTQRKQAVTGAVATANLNQFKDVPANDIMNKLKGSIPGLNVTGGNGKAGDEATIIIRGQNSITSGNNAPLIVVDGAIYNGSLMDISPYDVESFTVLKDASAAAVYGSRSGNGVILIETKRGSSDGKPEFSLNLNYGFSNELKIPHVYNAEEYLQRVLDLRELSGKEHDPANVVSYLTALEQQNYNATPDHKPTIPDPYGVFQQPGFNRGANFSISNRSEKTRYYISASFIDQNGVVKGDKYSHFSSRVNIDSDITDWLNIGVKVGYSYRDNGGQKLLNGNFKYYLSPYGSLYNEDGSYNMYPNGSKTVDNPLLMYYTQCLDDSNGLDAVVNARIKCPWVEGLTFTSIFSDNLNWSRTGTFLNKETYEGYNQKGVGEASRIQTSKILWDNILNYSRIFNQKHAVDATFLFSQEKYNYDKLYGKSSDFANDQLGIGYLDGGAKQVLKTLMTDSQALGLMARLTYTYDNRYSVTGTFRRDGFSAFGNDCKYGNFPSIGLNWNISNESFLKDSNVINNLALRATYGTTGNQSVSSYSTLGKVSNDKISFLNQAQYEMTQYVSSIGNSEVGWEKTTGLNLGLDFAILNNRISGNIDVYNTNTVDMLYSMPLPLLSGFSTISGNIGKINNKGIEIGLKTLNIDSDLKWRTDFAFSLNRNKIVSLLGEDNDKDGKEDDLSSKSYFIGQPINVLYGFNVVGMWQQEDKDNGNIISGYQPGEYKVEDVNNDGKIEKNVDYRILGYKDPNFRWSMTNTLEWKGFTLMVNIYSIWGGGKWFKSSECKLQRNNYEKKTDSNFIKWDTWTPSNTGAWYQRLDHSSTANKAYRVSDRSFIKLQKVSLSYDLSKFVKNWGIKGLSASVSGDNLYSFEPYWKGLDAEMEQGCHAYISPVIRTVTMSLNMNF